MSVHRPIMDLFERLYQHYGPQGWWPLLGHPDYYHPLEYGLPKASADRFEVILGSILTQNTTFLSVVKSLKNLKELQALTPEKILHLDETLLKEAIRPSGYYNQKARAILEFIPFFMALEGGIPTREALLARRGIGPESADSILLFAYHQPEFKVDAYTQRILASLGWIGEYAHYHEVKAMMEEGVGEQIKEREECVRIYQEYHALLVSHGKRHYSKKPYGAGCFLQGPKLVQNKILKRDLCLVKSNHSRLQVKIVDIV